jgi:carboxypeptidase A1
MTVAFIGYSLITGYNNNATVTQLVDQFEWTIVPITNVDGYLWTQTNRMWRKNRRVNANSSCKGVDINRNWSYKWNTGGSSPSPCSDIFLGPSPFSEPENNALAQWVGSHSNIVGYIDFHSFSQLYMTPWGWSTDLPKDYDAQIALANQAVAAMGSVNGVEYQAGSVANIIYIASGGSLDWTYGASNVKYSYAIELRDTGQYGFVLPASEIVPQGLEAFAGVVSMGEYLAQQIRRGQL